MEDALVIPGSYSEQTTVDDFRALFGESNVQIKAESIEDGGGSSLILFPDDPSRRAYVSFHDRESMSGVERISVHDRGSLWRGKLGVHIGMSLAELAALNEKCFIFSGFDTEGRGWANDGWSPALDDDDAKLGALDVQEGEHMYFGVEFGPRGSIAAVPKDAYPQDEISLLSNDSRFPRLGELFEITGFEAATSLDDEW